jgi:hypothetical protein
LNAWADWPLEDAVTGLVVIACAVCALLLALAGIGLAIGPARSDRWALKVFGPAPHDEPMYSDPGGARRVR